MEYRKSDLPPIHESSQSASAEEIPKKPHTPATQKIISCEISDISQVSEISGVANNEQSTINYNLPNAGNAYRSTTNCPQIQLQPSNATVLTDHIMPKQTIEPELQQIRQVAAAIQHKNPSLDVSHSVAEADKSSKLEAQCSDLNLSILLECLMKRQDEKMHALEEKMVLILEQKSVPCHSDPKMALVSNLESAEFVDSQKETGISSPGNVHSFGPESTQLFNCLQAQTEQIRKLQEQIQKLLEQNMKLLEEKKQLQDWNQELKCKLLFADKRESVTKFAEECCENERPTILNERQRKENCTQPETGKNKTPQNHRNSPHSEQTVPNKTCRSSKPTMDVGNVQFRENRVREFEEIEKKETSTMTSLIYDGSDKVLFHKTTTVTTQSKKQSGEISGQFTKSLKTPENRQSPRETGSSSRKKTCRKCGKCSPLNGSDKAKSPHSLNESRRGSKKTPKAIPESGGKTACGVLQTCEEEIQVHNTDSEKRISPRYENILRDVNELNLNYSEVETTPRLKPALKRSSKERKSYSPTPELSPKTEKRKYLNRRQSSNTSSNSSTSSPNRSIQETSPRKPELDSVVQESRTISKYALDSPALSKDTRGYLEKFGLTGDRIQSRKTKSRTLVKRLIL